MYSEARAAVPRHLQEIRLQNLRGFRDLVVPLTSEDGQPRQHTLLIGRNGTCKSSFLRAIALGLADASDAHALLASPIGRVVGSATDVSLIRLYLSPAPEPRVKVFAIRSAGGKEHGLSGTMPNSTTSPVFFAAYGAGRFFSGPESSGQSSYRALDAAAGLFNHPRPLSDPELTLRRLADFIGTRFYEQTLEGVKRVLGLTVEDHIGFSRGGGVEVSGPTVGKPIRLEAWADGYRVTFTWLLDFFGWALRAGAIDDEGVVRGILLVDEIDQHLHPSMQAQVLPRLRELLPEVQVIATTHSPLVALGAQPDELVALHRLESGEVVTVPAPDFRLYSVEDMLTDDRLFATPPFSEEVNQKTDQYRQLAAIPKEQRKKKQQQQLRGLAQELSRPAEPSDPDVAAFEQVQAILARHGMS